MTDAQEIIALELARISRIDMSEAPPYARASIHTAALHINRALHAAGFRIIGPDEVDAVTDKMVEAAQEAYRRVGKQHHWHPSWPDDDAMREILSAALAQEGK